MRPVSSLNSVGYVCETNKAVPKTYSISTWSLSSENSMIYSWISKQTNFTHKDKLDKKTNKKKQNKQTGLAYD